MLGTPTPRNLPSLLFLLHFLSPNSHHSDQSCGFRGKESRLGAGLRRETFYPFPANTVSAPTSAFGRTLALTRPAGTVPAPTRYTADVCCAFGNGTAHWAPTAAVPAHALSCNTRVSLGSADQSVEKGGAMPRVRVGFEPRSRLETVRLVIQLLPRVLACFFLLSLPASHKLSCFPSWRAENLGV